MDGLPEQALERVARYFQTLAEPTRLRILNALRHTPHSVGELATVCECSIANVSRHLAQLARQGMVIREERGTSVFYSIADPAIYALCDIVCGSIARQHADFSRMMDAGDE
ncbi:metalloregulator ArsR/SmtB family transcription factor [Burkholderiaceae bacterium DAT-1]|nr:metalloregulator ArsR/SmtB family transcription factor [Burkholderiaceae bacterium DAT-1]